MNTRLIMAILSNSLIEAIIVAVVLWGLPRLGCPHTVIRPYSHLPGLLNICSDFLQRRKSHLEEETAARFYYHGGR